MAIKGRVLQGVSQMLPSIFKGGDKGGPHEKKDKPDKRYIIPGYPIDAPKLDRIRCLGQRVYREGSFEKIQFVRKWMRNALMFQGYHELEWSEINVAWEAIIRDSGDYAFPNNYYRSHIMYGAGLYVKNAPQFNFLPTSQDFDAQAIAQAAKEALNVIKENVHYDSLRVWEAIYLRLFGNSFRYSYYSLDPRYGSVTSNVFGKKQTQIDNGSFQCGSCGNMGPGNIVSCPQCGSAAAITNTPPTLVDVPETIGQVSFPRGQEVSEVVSPMEVGMRSSSSDIFHAPYLYRARIVDRVALQNDFPDIDLMTSNGMGLEASGGAVAESAQDLSLIYLQSLADLPGDPTQYAAWYERATSFARGLFLQVWLRPNQYAHDKTLLEEFPDGMYAGLYGDKVLESRNENLDDHWTMFRYNVVPGRIWADGDDDLIPKQLQLNETERMILRNQAYSAVPQLVVDRQRIDTDSVVNDPAEIIPCKMTGRPVAEAIHQLQGQSLPQETWQWRASQLQDMEYHSGVFGAAIGQHQPGVNTYGGQELMAARTEQNLSPLLLMYKEANEIWARQMIKLAAKNWLDDRVHAVMGINGNWEFTKLRGMMLDIDQVKIVAQLIPIDYGQQQALAEAVTSGLLNPQDPRVQKKALELFQLPTELNSFSLDAKVQWKEIEKMKQGQPVHPVMLRDNDAVHIEICRVWLNSDEAEDTPPEIVNLVYAHLQEHMMNQAGAMQAAAAIQMAPQEVAAKMGMQMPQPGGGAPGQGGPQAPGNGPASQGKPGNKPPQPGQGQQAGRAGGQVPRSPNVRHQRAQKANAAAPNRPQPPSGNQFHRGKSVGGR